MNYVHKLYLPNISHVIRDNVTDGLTNKWGGCTVYHSMGYWKDGEGQKMIEPVLVVEVITDNNKTPQTFLDAADDLIALGEECVLVTTQEVDSQFISRS